MMKGRVNIKTRRGIEDYVPFTASEVEELFKMGDYSLLYLPFATFAPYVVAVGFNATACTWVGGWCFRSREDAMSYIYRLM